MSDSAGEVSVGIVASIDGLLNGLNRASGAVKASTDDMAGHFDSLGRVIENLKAPFLALTAVLGGGALFKHAIDSTKEWYGEVIALSKATGLSTQKSSGLALAMEEVGVSSDAYTNGIRMLSRQVATGAQGFERFHISVKDASTGGLRPATDIMNDALDKIRAMEPGLAQNTAGTIMFGRAWSEVAPLLKLSKEAIDEATVKAERLGLTVGPDGAQKLRDYKRALADVSALWKAVSVQMGSELMPVLTNFGHWLGETGSDGVSHFTEITKFLASVIDGLVTGFMSLYTRIQMIYNAVVGVGAAIVAFKDNLGKGVGAATEAAGKAIDEYTAKNKSAAAAIDEIWARYDARALARSGPAVTDGRTPQGSSKGGSAFIPDKNKEKYQAPSAEKDTRLSEWEAELTAQKNQEENWFTWSTDREKAFWTEKLGLTRDSLDLNWQIQGKMNELGKTAATADHAQTISSLRENLEEYRDDGEMRLRILRSIRDQEVQVSHEGSKQVLAIDKEIAKEVNQQAKKAAESRKAWISGFVDPFVASMAAGIKGLITGTMSLKDAIVNVADSMANAVINVLVKMASQWIVSKLVEMTATKAAAISESSANIAIAATGAAASQAAIPIVGPGLAMGAAASMATFLTAFIGPLLSAANGFDIPAGLNPRVQLHEQEMVLPAKYANPLRKMLTGGGLGGGGGDNYQVQITAVDAHGLEDMLNRNFTALTKVVRKQARDGRPLL